MQEQKDDNETYFGDKDTHDEEIDHEYVEEEAPEVTKSFSRVAINKGSTLVVLVILCCVSFYFIYKAFAPTQQEELEKEKQAKIAAHPVVKPPAEVNQQVLVPLVPALPEAPKLAAPTPPPPVIEAPKPKEHVVENVVTQPPIRNDFRTENQNIAPIPVPMPLKTGLSEQQIQARKKSGMSVYGGGGGAKATNLVDSASDDSNDIPITGSQVKATRIGDMSRVVAEGKLIDAILESAVNTDLPGLVRGIVSHDVYAENGASIVIPKGSRLIGKYDSGVAIGQQRVQINWTRLIRPDGIDIALDSIATDPLGSAGAQAHVDNKYFQIFAGTMMLSILNISFAGWNDVLNAKDGVTQPQTYTTTTIPSTTTGGTTNNNNNNGAPIVQSVTIPGQQGKRPLQSAARQQAINDFGDKGRKIIENQMDHLKPTLTIPQGTKVKVFVTKDLVFPKISNSSSNIGIIQ